jgi:capsid protein
LAHERNVPADWFHLHAYYGRFDQYRGVSPVSEAYNQLRDLYEAEDYALIRSKIASLFAMAITRNADKPVSTLTETEEGGYEVDFNGKPIFLDMQPGDDAKFIDSDNPGGNLQDFWVFVSMVALKSLDIPYGMFDESKANFFGNKTAWLGYDRACDDKRKRVRKLLNLATAHKYRCLIRERKILLPRGVTIAQRPWRWVPRKMPWWRPLEEVTANLKAIGGGLTTPQRVCQESDTGDWYQNVDDIAAAKAYAAKKGVVMSFEIDPETAAAVAESRRADS